MANGDYLFIGPFFSIDKYAFGDHNRPVGRTPNTRPHIESIREDKPPSSHFVDGYGASIDFKGWKLVGDRWEKSRSHDELVEWGNGLSRDQ